MHNAVNEACLVVKIIRNLVDRVHDDKHVIDADPEEHKRKDVVNVR